MKKSEKREVRVYTFILPMAIVILSVIFLCATGMVLVAF